MQNNNNKTIEIGIGVSTAHIALCHTDGEHEKRNSLAHVVVSISLCAAFSDSRRCDCEPENQTSFFKFRIPIGLL